MIATDSQPPHLGQVINSYMVSNRITKAEAARKMGVTQTEVSKYLSRPSLQFHVLWNFCIALQHDFFADLQNCFPESFPRWEDSRIGELRKEIEILERVLRNK